MYVTNANKEKKKKKKKLPNPLKRSFDWGIEFMASHYNIHYLHSMLIWSIIQINIRVILQSMWGQVSFLAHN